MGDKLGVGERLRQSERERKYRRGKGWWNRRGVGQNRIGLQLGEEERGRRPKGFGVWTEGWIGPKSGDAGCKGKSLRLYSKEQVNPNSHLLIVPPGDNTVQPIEGTRGYKQDVGRVYLHCLTSELTRGVALRYIHNCALQHLLWYGVKRDE